MVFTSRYTNAKSYARTPSFIKHCCQAMLAAQWTHRLPLIQPQCAGELAADLLGQMLDEIEDINRERYTVIDFCSGAGGLFARFMAQISE